MSEIFSAGARVKWMRVLLGAAAMCALSCSRGQTADNAVRKTVVAEQPGHVLSTAPPVQVRVNAIPVTGGMKYSYRVINGSPFRVVGIGIGYDAVHDDPELTQLPLGWNADTLPSSSHVDPPGWVLETIPTEESDLLTVQWVSDTTAASPGSVAGGQSLGNFEVIVATSDLAYRNGHWIAYLDTGDEAPYVGQLTFDNTVDVPPASVFSTGGLHAEPNPASGKVRFSFELPRSGQVDVDIFDVNGRRVSSMSLGSRSPGPLSTTWDGRADDGKNLPAGTYFARVRSKDWERFARFVWLGSGHTQ